jgi:hypothetical protein
MAPNRAMGASSTCCFNANNSPSSAHRVFGQVDRRLFERTRRAALEGDGADNPAVSGHRHRAQRSGGLPLREFRVGERDQRTVFGLRRETHGDGLVRGLVHRGGNLAQFAAAPFEIGAVRQRNDLDQAATAQSDRHPVAVAGHRQFVRHGSGRSV